MVKTRSRSQRSQEPEPEPEFVLTFRTGAFSGAGGGGSGISRARSTQSRSQSRSQGCKRNQSRSRSRSQSVDSAASSLASTRSRRSSSAESFGSFRTESRSGYSSDDSSMSSSVANSSHAGSSGGRGRRRARRGSRPVRAFNLPALRALARKGVPLPEGPDADTVLGKIGLQPEHGGDEDGPAFLDALKMLTETAKDLEMIELEMLVGGEVVPTVIGPGEGMHYCERWTYALVPAGSQGQDYQIRVANNTNLNVGIEIAIDGKVTCRNWPCNAQTQRLRNARGDRYFNSYSYKLQKPIFETLGGNREEQHDDDDADGEECAMSDSEEEQQQLEQQPSQQLQQEMQGIIAGANQLPAPSVLQTEDEFHQQGRAMRDEGMAALTNDEGSRQTLNDFKGALPGPSIEVKAFVTKWKKSGRRPGRATLVNIPEGGQPQQVPVLAVGQTKGVSLSTGYGAGQPIQWRGGGGRAVRVVGHDQEPLAVKMLVYRQVDHFNSKARKEEAEASAAQSTF